MIWIAIPVFGLGFLASAIWIAINVLGVRDALLAPRAPPLTASDEAEINFDDQSAMRRREWWCGLIFWPITLAWMVRDRFDSVKS